MRNQPIMQCQWKPSWLDGLSFLGKLDEETIIFQKQHEYDFRWNLLQLEDKNCLPNNVCCVCQDFQWHYSAML